MGLSMDERRQLEEIDRQLTFTDPRLATRLASLPGSRPVPRPWPDRTSPTAPPRPAAVMSWNAVAVAVLLFLLAAATHVALLTGLGVVLLLAGGTGLLGSRRRRERPPPDAQPPEAQPPEDPIQRP
jgi:hypothetical protein